MRQLPGNNWLASRDQLPYSTSFDDVARYGFSSNGRELSLWTVLFSLSLLLTFGFIAMAIYLLVTRSPDFAALASVAACVTVGIAGFMLSRPPWSLTLNGPGKSYALRTGVRPFVKLRSGPLTDIRGIGAAKIHHRGEEACVLFLVFATSDRPFYLAWHPLSSAHIVAHQAAKIAKELNVPAISSNQVLKG